MRKAHKPVGIMIVSVVNNDFPVSYCGWMLTTDVTVPEGGYSAPYVYGTTGMDGIRESVDMFRFKLE